MFLVSRADLPPGMQAVQACHAAFAFAVEHPERTRSWSFGSNNLVLTEVRDEVALRQLAERAGKAGLCMSAFFEPDLGDQLTALAIEPRGRRICGSLPLAMKER